MNPIDTKIIESSFQSKICVSDVCLVSVSRLEWKWSTKANEVVELQSKKLKLDNERGRSLGPKLKEWIKIEIYIVTSGTEQYCRMSRLRCVVNRIGRSGSGR